MIQKFHHIFENEKTQILKEFEYLSVEKRFFRLRWDSSPGLSKFQTHLINFRNSNFLDSEHTLILLLKTRIKDKNSNFN